MTDADPLVRAEQLQERLEQAALGKVYIKPDDANLLRDLAQEVRDLRASQENRQCAHGHTQRKVGCVSCVMVFDWPTKRAAEAHREALEAENRDLRASHGILDHVVAAIGRVLCGEPISDFDESYAEVRGVVDLIAHREAQITALRDIRTFADAGLKISWSPALSVIRLRVDHALSVYPTTQETKQS